ncbi:hypothetical protein DNTS_022846 [Danionella cerebrum]|uniref:PDZ and pleckstrin homology domains 1 n=1 Tax=Danionella cerebrum TaxID=2873325 RepID=A0A553PZ77_9TELE|nr:hypothetical protein DNTS_022846 [Danionella translucida]
MPSDSNITITITPENLRVERKENLKDENDAINPHGEHSKECVRKTITYKISITELNDTESTCASMSQKTWDEQEDTACRKSCCKNYCPWGGQTDTDFTLVDGSSRSSSLSDFWQRQKQPSLPTSVSDEHLEDIPPPDQFADEKYSTLESLAENVASYRIGPKENSPGTASEFPKDFRSQNTADCEKMRNKSRESDSHSESSTQDDFFMNPRLSINRSSFTKNFIKKHERKIPMRNNSIAILQSKTNPSSYMEIPAKRRKTFPGVSYHAGHPRGSIPSYRESFSSGTLSSFFMQSLPCQAEKMGRFYMDDERLWAFESRKSSSSSSYRRSSSSTTGPEPFNPKLKAYSTIRNPFYASRSDESPEDVFFRGESYQGHVHPDEMQQSSLEAGAGAMFADQDSSSAGQPELNEVNESGFEEEMGELEESFSRGNSMDRHQRELLIHVIPPSLNNSVEQIDEGIPYSLMLSPCVSDEASAPVKRRGSVMTIINGDSEQRFLQGKRCYSIDEDVSLDTLSPVSKSSTLSPIEDLGSIREAVEELQDSSEDQTTIIDMSMSPQNPVEAQTIESLLTISQDVCRTPKLCKNEFSGRQSALKEVKEHLKPPTDSIHKDSEEHPDHWARRRKLFKESKQRSSAGGSSITSIITEESDTMNSEDTRSVDMSIRDIEDRGFYTETFHSVSWIYHGDDVNQNESPNCLRSCTRPASIRERTVKICKGMGEYPWGFRIQFSKPIVVTEVDTNGPAEEAGLQVGDYVLAVNGTDVTSVPHSEAADLARQGPDLLTLTIGSDIGRTPNTPRPACRGYLHKRTQSSFLKGWRKRWFVLKHDCCLYYYRNKRDEGKSQALSVMSLEGALVEADSSLGKPFVFRCCPVAGNRVYYLYATSNQEMKRWLEAMDRAVHPITQNHVWVDVTRHNSNLPPLAVKSPECLGLLHQLDRSKDSWIQYYCVLKDGCLYFYTSIRSTSAIGGIYLHGYTVKDVPLGTRRSTIELRPPSDEFKVFHLCAENINENKRWIGAIKSSVIKWLPLHQAIQDYMSRPPEETRM